MTDEPRSAQTSELVERAGRAIAEHNRPADISEGSWWRLRGKDFLEQGAKVIAALTPARSAVEAERDALRAALEQMLAEKIDYMTINNLGDPETQHTVKAARQALVATESQHDR